MQQARHRLRIVRVLLVAQLVGALAVGAIGFAVGVAQGQSALAGGLICWLPNCYFAYRAFRHRGARAARQIMRAFYAGEAGKMFLTMGLFAVVFIRMENLSAPALFAGYIAVLMLNWAVPLLVSQREARNQ